VVELHSVEDLAGGAASPARRWSGNAPFDFR